MGQIRVALALCLLMLGGLAPVLARAAFDSADAPQAGDLEIIRVTPDGEDVPAQKQIVIQFNRPVVPIGVMERKAAELPISIQPQVNCDWRWINNTALACNLPDAAPLQESTEYRIEINPGIKAEDGATIPKTYTHRFITTRPDVRYHEFRQWRAPGQPVVRLIFNQPVERESVRRHVFLGVGDKGARRVRLEVQPDPNDRTPPEFVPVPGESYGLFFPKAKPQKSDDDLHKNADHEARRIWLVEPVRPLPLDTKIIVKTEPGLVSALGPEKGIKAEDVVTFDTYPEFAFLGIKCLRNDGADIFVPVGQEAKDKCNPMQPVRLSFTAPVQRRQMGKMLAFQPPIEGWTPPGEEANAEAEDGTSGGSIGYEYRMPHTKGKTYEIWLPAGLKAAQPYHLQSRALSMNMLDRLWYRITARFEKRPPIDVRDIFGRRIDQTLVANFVTDHRPPNYVLEYSDVVLEKGVESELPFYVNNLTEYGLDYRRVTPAESAEDLTFRKRPPNVQDVQFAVPFGVREMLRGGTGAIFGSLYTDPQVSSYRPRLFAQVTPYQVHLKLGHFNSLVWVTDMATGAPVANARLSLYEDAFTTLQAVNKPSAKATTNEAGIAILPGTDTLDPDLQLSRAWRDDDTRYFLRVEKGGDMALLPIADSFIIDSYRISGSETVYPSNKERYGHMRAWGTTAQGIYRAGDTIQYKIYVRNQDNNRFIPAPGRDYRLKIIDPTGKVVHDLKKLRLSEFGGISGEFTVPKEGAVGWYQFKLIADFASKSQYADNDSEADDAEEQPDSGADGRNDEETEDDNSKRSWIPMRVLVSDFTPAAFKVSNQLNGDLFHPEQQIDVATNASLYSGGAYTDAVVRVTAILDSAPFFSQHPLARNFQFDSNQNELSSQQLFQKIDKLNDKGELALNFTTGTPDIVYGKLLVESAVADDRGKYVTGQARADYIGVDRLVGLKAMQWLYNTGKPAILQYIVVDAKGAPAKGTPVNIRIEQQVTTAARVKGAGNAYLTEYNTDWVDAGSCKGVSEEAPLECVFTPTKAGSFRAIATIADAKGHSHSTTLSLYATGSDFVMWDNGSDSGLTIVPERTDYKIGDTARYLVKNPYPGAKALITIERYGVLDQFVQTFDSTTPVIEFKVKPDYLPGFYLSVLAVSPRVDKPIDAQQVDLGKPTYRMGYVTVPVKDPYKEMVVTAKSDKEVYKPRETVTVTLEAKPRMKTRNEPIELAVAVLDESVFDLIAGGRSYFDPYAGFYKLESLDLRNYSLLTRLVGRQRFEKKGANPGGDGGADLSMRSLFKFVSYWNGTLKTDAQGRATVRFEAPDNLTGWRILAMATTPSDRFGLGEGSFKVNQPTEIRPVMPNQIMEGDHFNAGFSVMNRTDKARTLDIVIHAEGHLDAQKVPADHTATLTLEPYKRATVSMPVQVGNVPLNRDMPTGTIRFTVTAGDMLDHDGLVHELPVQKRRSLEVAANYGTTTQNRVEEPVLFPKDILPDVGGLSIVAAPTVIGNLSGAFKYMRDYPYMCWEQKLSKGVMAAHYKNLRTYLPNSLVWDDSQKLPQRTLDQAASFQAPNGGMTYFKAQDEYVDPYLSAYTALAFNWLRKSGYAIPQMVEDKLHEYLGNLLKNDDVPDFYEEGMVATVRAVALAALGAHGKADLSDLERYRPHVKDMSLLGKSYFLQAALTIPDGAKYAPDIAKMILATSQETGGKFVFNETWDDSYTRILASPLRENCAVLDAFTLYGEHPEGQRLIGDVPFKLVRTITQTRKNRDHWENTQENMFCMNALIDFARIYEKEPPNMTVAAALEGQNFGTARFGDVRDPAAVLERPIKEGDAGQRRVVQIERSGTGRLYYATRLAYALPTDLSKPANAGIEVHREYSIQQQDGHWVLLQAPAQLKRGALVRVDLYVSIPAARNFVVVDDPVPGGLEPINRDLATSSEVDARAAEFEAAGGAFWFKFSDWVGFGFSRWNFYHQELRHDSVRFYADYLPAGNYHLSYAAQAIATGTFSALPAIASEMYDPDVYGKSEGARMEIRD